MTVTLALAFAFAFAAEVNAQNTKHKTQNSNIGFGFDAQPARAKAKASGGIDPDTELQSNTMNDKQSDMLRFLLQQLKTTYPDATIHGANELLHPDEPPEDNEPFFNVQSWLSKAEP